YVCEDNVKINNSHLSIGTIIMRQAMIKHMDFTTLTASDIALVKPAMLKIHKVFKNPLDIEECFWNSKTHQKKAPKSKEKLGYELSSIM
ncbi:hypothetical protein K501DRAFT_173849, partial [Backusella circina FSU 941]